MAMLRDCARAIADARDSDALLATVRDLRELYAGDVPAVAFTRLERALRKRARMTRGDQGGGLPETAERLDAGLSRLESISMDEVSVEATVGELRRFYAAGRAAARRARRQPTIENLHEWRKRVKDLWYQERLMQTAWVELAEFRTAQAHRLSDLLGDDHDLALLLELLREERGAARPRRQRAADSGGRRAPHGAPVPGGSRSERACTRSVRRPTGGAWLPSCGRSTRIRGGMPGADPVPDVHDRSARPDRATRRPSPTAPRRADPADLDRPLALACVARQVRRRDRRRNRSRRRSASPTSRRGLPPSTSALLVHTVLVPSRTLRLIVATLDSETWTPARAPAGSVCESNAIVGGLWRSLVKPLAVVQ